MGKISGSTDSHSKINSIQPAVAVMIRDEQQRILLQKRADVGQWGVISGHIEPGETAEKAAMREVLEEAGLHVRIKRFIGLYSDPASQVFHYPNGENVHFITVYVEAEVVGGRLKTNSDESLDFRYFSLSELPTELVPMQPQWLEDVLLENGLTFLR